MIRVMIVDDEPFIRQGLRIVLDWEKYGFEIRGEASNGQEAIKLMEHEEYDLIITDIKMPNMNGLELIEHTKSYISKSIKFIILSGFYEFEYAKKAIQNGVADYVLKPVQKEELIKVLQNYKEEFYAQKEDKKRIENSEKIIFDRHIQQLLSGNVEDEAIIYIKKHLRDITHIRYVGIEVVSDLEDEELLDNEKRIELQRELLETFKEILGEKWFHIFLPSESERDYSIGFIYSKALASDLKMAEKEYINYIYNKLSCDFGKRLLFFIGKKIKDIKQLSETYKTAYICRRSQLLSKGKEGAYYYDDVKEKIITSKYPLEKKKLDDLLKAIERNDRDSIKKHIDVIYEDFKELILEPEIIKMNIDYLLVNLINIANELNPNLGRDEIRKIIKLEDYEQIVIRDGINKLKSFAFDFADYLSSLRQHTFGGTLADVINEINDNYMDDLSLKELSQKYYINSAYLGQIFKKQMGCSFKDYLNNYRIEKATESYFEVMIRYMRLLQLCRI